MPPKWLGWSHYRLTSPNGKTILTNPFAANPDSPVSVDDMDKADLILAADEQRDEVGSTVPVAQATGARVLVPFEIGSWLVEKGVPEDQVV